MVEQQQDLIDLLTELPASAKINDICQRLVNADFELRGRLNPQLQISASAVVFRQGRLLMVEHPYQKEWLLPAGHVELGETPLATAIRELTEETGLVAQTGQLIDVNLIEIPANPIKDQGAHQHIDFRFQLQVQDWQLAEAAELPWHWMTEAETPVEFQPYFALLK